MTQAQKAERFRALHAAGAFILPNAWDAASARILEDAGFSAIATTSAGIAFACGFPDGERLPRDMMVEAIGRIASAVRVPVTADIERGYGATPDDVADTVSAVIAAGAVGVNLEDGTGDPEHPLIAVDRMVARIEAASATAETAGIGFVINARTDGYISGATGEPAFADAVARANAYLAAGADCAFVPWVQDLGVIRRLAASIAGPLNVVVSGPGMPPLKDLEAAGVRRVTLGGSLMRAMMGRLRDTARQLLRDGVFGYAGASIPHGEMNALFDRTSG